MTSRNNSNNPMSITLSDSDGDQQSSSTTRDKPSPSFPSSHTPPESQLVASLNAKVRELSDELERAYASGEDHRRSSESTSRLVSSLQTTESDLKSQLSTLLAMKKDSTGDNHQQLTALLTMEQEKNHSLQERINQLVLQNSQLQEKVDKSEEHVSKIEKAHAATIGEQRQKLTLLESSIVSDANTHASAQSELESRVAQLEKALQDSRRNSATVQALANENEKEAYLWKSKYESEAAHAKKIVQEYESKISEMEQEMAEKLVSQSQTLMQQQERFLSEARELGSSRQLFNTTDLEKKHADEVSRIQQENERYVALMQQQAASQTSVIDRLIHQNADLVKAVEFARRVLQESKNPDSVGALVADNDRLQDELESSQKELTALRQRNKDLESKATYFEGECDELVRRLNSIDYRLLVPTTSNPPPASTPVQSSALSSSSSSMATTSSSMSATSLSTQSSQIAPILVQNHEAKPDAHSSSSSYSSVPVSTVPSSSPLSSSSSSASVEASSAFIPPTPGTDWQPKSPVGFTTALVDSSPGKTPSRFTPAVASSAPAPAPAPFIVTAPLDATQLLQQHQHSTFPGLQHGHLSPQINLDDLGDTVSMDLGESAPTQTQDKPSAAQSPSSNRPLKVPPQRGLIGRIWQAVTLQ